MPRYWTGQTGFPDGSYGCGARTEKGTLSNVLDSGTGSIWLANTVLLRDPDQSQVDLGNGEQGVVVGYGAQLFDAPSSPIHRVLVDPASLQVELLRMSAYCK